MIMIKLINDIPLENTKRMFVACPNFNGEHIFDLSNYDTLIYYYKLFENRTNEDKSYIDKYSSLKELEEDIYGKCTHIEGGDWTTRDFKDIYNNLNKEEFLNKINVFIKEYGNLINTYTIVVCIKTDEPIKLLSFIKSEVPDVETWNELSNKC